MPTLSEPRIAELLTPYIGATTPESPIYGRLSQYLEIGRAHV